MVAKVYPQQLEVSRAKKKHRYKTDLKAQHLLAELNYARLMRLLGHNLTTQLRQFDLPILSTHCVQVALEITERCPYTTMLTLSVVDSTPKLSSHLRFSDFDIRLYHDVKLAEIIRCNRSGRIEPRYEYPNKRMFLPDEKHQLNCLLGEWLAQLLREAYPSGNVFHKVKI